MFDPDKTAPLRPIGIQAGLITLPLRYIKKELRLFPYKLQMSPELDENDKQNRLFFDERYRKRL